MSPNALQPVDDDLRRQARILVRTARHGTLALLDRFGAPVTTRVRLATQADGQPVFMAELWSGLMDDVTEQARASLLIVESGGDDPLSLVQMSLQGRISQLVGVDDERARRRYRARYPQPEPHVELTEGSLWRLDITTATFITGFGRAYAMVADDVRTAFADWPAWHAMEGGAVAHMNDDHADANQLYASVLLGARAGDWRLTGLDPQGLDLTCGDEHRRLEFEFPLSQASALRPTLVDLVREARRRQTQATPSA
ncbi:MAG: DUF2470 domain-containing protein [Pseudomonadota bacterium]